MPNISANLHQLVNQYEKTVMNNFWLSDPFASIVPRKSFMPDNGEVPMVLSLTGERPTSYPSSLANVNVTDGPGSSGDVTATAVSTGQTKRTFQLEATAWRSNTVNLSDAEFRQDPEAVLRNIGGVLTEYGVAHNSDYHRYKSLGMMDNKAVVTAAGDVTEASDSNFDFSSVVITRENTAQAGGATSITLDTGASAVDDTYNGLTIYIVSGTGAGQSKAITDYVGSTKVATVSTWGTNPDNTSVFRILTGNNPAAGLDWDVLDYLYNQVSRRGGRNFAFGMSEGQPVFSLTTGAEMKRKLFKTDLQADIRYFDPKNNFTVRGITSAVNGYMPNYDLLPIRYDEFYNIIYPFVNQSTTKGQESVLNPNWAPVSKGGNALYEAGYIMTRDIWELCPRIASPTRIADATFPPQNYTGEIEWINNKTFEGDNDKGNKGYYRVDWQAAAKPIRPELGYGLLYKIPSEV